MLLAGNDEQRFQRTRVEHIAMNSPYEPPPPPPPPPPGPPTHVQPAQSPYPPVTQGTSGKATASMVLGICSIAVCPIIPGVLAIIFGIMAKREIDENPGMEGRGQAQAGVILGIVGLALWTIAIIAYIAIIIVAVSATDDYSYGDDYNYDSYSYMLPQLFST